MIAFTLSHHVHKASSLVWKAMPANERPPREDNTCQETMNNVFDKFCRDSVSRTNHFRFRIFGETFHSDPLEKRFSREFEPKMFL